MMKSECVQEKKKKGKEERDCKQFNALFQINIYFKFSK